MHMVTTFWPADTEAGQVHGSVKQDLKQREHSYREGEGRGSFHFVHDQEYGRSQGSLAKIQVSTS